MTNKRQFFWFRLNRTLHRDVGFFCIGMTLVFAISGIALNHINDWNSNYSVSQQTYEIAALATKIKSDNFETWLLKEINLQAKVKARFWQNPKTYKLFTKNGTVIINIALNTVFVEQIKARPLLRSLNFLHLNEAKKAWVYFSDLYALMLIFLSISALFMVKGRYSALGKRSWLVIAGLVTPAGFVFYYAG